MQNIVINMCEKFHYDRLRNDKALGNQKSENNNPDSKHKNKNNVRGHWGHSAIISKSLFRYTGPKTSETAIQTTVGLYSITQTYQGSRISRETPAFWSHLPLTRRITKISRISGTKFGQLILSKMVKLLPPDVIY